MLHQTLRILVGAIATTATALAGTLTTEPSYLLAPANGNFTFQPLLTTGDRVPLTGTTAGQQYAFAGIPDAMGIYRDPVSNEIVLFCAHEMSSGVSTAPIFGQNPQQVGAFVSRYSLAQDGSVNSGGLAHDDLFSNNTFVLGNAPRVGDTLVGGTFTQNGFTRFCSGKYAGPAEGMDRPIFLTNEESSSGNINSAGSQVVAVLDGNMHMLPDLGRVARENTVVQPRRDAYTAIIMTEDGGSTASGGLSYIYLYVGTKQRRATDALSKNGLIGGELYVLGAVSGAANESTFTTGSLPVKWVKIPNGKSLTADALSAQATQLGAFGFVRVEDAEFDPTNPTRTCFVGVTGGSGPNTLGRLYRLNMNPTNPLANGTMDVIYNADLIVKPNGNINDPSARDYPVSIDNIAVTKDWIVICEDRNSPADAVFAKYGRQGGVWTLDRNNNFAAKYQADFNHSYAATRDGVSLSPGTWEASGVVDASEFFGPNTFVINVQAHSTDRSNIPNPAGGVFTKAQADDFYAEDGQLLLMRPKP